MIDATGWAGAGLLLVSYWLVSRRRVLGDSGLYQGLNAVGSLALLANTYVHRAYPSAFVNLVWLGIAIYTLGGRRWRERGATA